MGLVGTMDYYWIVIIKLILRKRSLWIKPNKYEMYLRTKTTIAPEMRTFRAELEMSHAMCLSGSAESPVSWEGQVPWLDQLTLSK